MGALPTLSASLVRDSAFRGDGLIMPNSSQLTLPVRAVQFGTGALLRGLVDYFLDEANRQGAFGGRIVAIGSTGSGRDQAINEQDGLYTLVTRGVARGARIEERRVVASVRRAISASDDWAGVLECARNPQLELVFSNTTEVGIALDEGDDPALAPPRSFPGKLTMFLHERARTFGFAGDKGVIVLPCELIERNGEHLREIVLQLATRWRLGVEFTRWIEQSVLFCNTLVDRIVPGSPRGEDAAQLQRELGFRDAMLTACEPYRLLAIECDPSLRAGQARILETLAAANEGIVVADDITPYRERKVRLLNGAHTIMVPAALLAGCETVGEAVAHESLGRFLRQALLDEIVPGLTVPGAGEFARDVLDRFANPHIRHRLLDITLHQTAKMRVRVVPSLSAYATRHGRAPMGLAFGFAAYLAYVRDLALDPVRAAALPDDAERVRVAARWQVSPERDDATLAAVARDVCADADLWGADLASLPGFAEATGDHLVRIERMGLLAALDAHLGSGASRA
jgi:tagaturonate reductase